MTPEFRMRVASVHATCERCKRPLWAALPPAEQAGLLELCDSVGTPRRFRKHCPSCDKWAQEQIELEALRRRYEEGYNDRRISPGLYEYRQTPPALRALNRAHWEWADRWESGRGNVLVMGSEGTGKSSLCRYIMSRAFEHFRCGAMDLPAVDIEYRHWRLDADKEVQRACLCGVLLIDDISNVQWTRRGLDSLRRILDARHERRKDTLITSNANEKELHDLFTGLSNTLFTESMLRRLRPLYRITMAGDSYRATMEYGE